MVAHSLPSLPVGEKPTALTRKGTGSSTKPAKPAHQTSKRVWKACERCKMKKSKCDGDCPCKRCKNDGAVCSVARNRTKYKRLSQGYAEVLESNQIALIATIQKLYSMLRKNETWDLGEPELNSRGKPVVHVIAQKLGCIRPNGDIDLPEHSVFPEDEAGMAELAQQLEKQQHHDIECQQKDTQETGSPGHNRAAPFAAQSLSLSMFPDWTIKATVPPETTMQCFQQTGMFRGMSMMGPGLAGNDIGTIDPSVLSMVSNPSVMMAMGDPMAYSGYDDESARL